MTTSDQDTGMQRLKNVLQELRAGKLKSQIDFEGSILERPIAEEIEDALSLVDDAALEAVIIVVIGAFAKKYREEIHEAISRLLRERKTEGS